MGNRPNWNPDGRARYNKEKRQLNQKRDALSRDVFQSLRHKATFRKPLPQHKGKGLEWTVSPSTLKLEEDVRRAHKEPTNGLNSLSRSAENEIKNTRFYQ